MDTVDAREWLNRAWQEALESEDQGPDAEMDALTSAPVVGIRYAILTQLLGKHADHSRDLLCLQRGAREGAEGEGRWDPRSFSTAVVVPWVQETAHVLGTSAEPYASKPLRRPRLDQGTSAVRNQHYWAALTSLLAEVQERNDPTYTEEMLRRCLASIVRRFSELQVAYPVPQRASLEQVLWAVGELLAFPSGGEASLVVVAALLRVLASATGLFERVQRQGINEADTASGAPGDVLCFRSGDPVPALAVEVKDRSLTLVELNTTIQKARQARVTEVLFATKPPQVSDQPAVEARIREEWGQGTSVYQIDIPDMMRAMFPMLGPEALVEFLREIGADFDARAVQPSLRTTWAQTLRDIASAT